MIVYGAEIGWDHPGHSAYDRTHAEATSRRLSAVPANAGVGCSRQGTGPTFLSAGHPARPAHFDRAGQPSSAQRRFLPPSAPDFVPVSAGGPRATDHCCSSRGVPLAGAVGQAVVTYVFDLVGRRAVTVRSGSGSRPGGGCWSGDLLCSSLSLRGPIRRPDLLDASRQPGDAGQRLVEQETAWPVADIFCWCWENLRPERSGSNGSSPSPWPRSSSRAS